MLRTLVILVVVAAPARPDPHDPRRFRVESAPAHVEVEVSSQHFRWRFGVAEGPAIAAVAWDMPYAYDMAVPEGWMFTYEDPHFRAWATDPAKAIAPGGVLEIVGRAGSSGGVLAPTTVVVERAGDAAPILLEGVPAPGPRSRALALLVVAALGGFAALGTAIARRRAGRGRPHRDHEPRTDSTVG